MHFREVDLCCHEGAVPHAHDPENPDPPPLGGGLFSQRASQISTPREPPPASRVHWVPGGWCVPEGKASFSIGRRENRDIQPCGLVHRLPCVGYATEDQGDWTVSRRPRKRKDEKVNDYPRGAEATDPQRDLAGIPPPPPNPFPGVWDGRDLGAKQQPKQSTLSLGSISIRMSRQLMLLLLPPAWDGGERGGDRGALGSGYVDAQPHPVFLFFLFRFYFIFFRCFFFSRHATAYARRQALGAGAVTQRP